MTEVSAIRKRLEAATAGPWRYDTDDEGCSMGWVGQINPEHPILLIPLFDVCGDSGQQADNATFIAHAPTDIAYLLSELSASRAREVGMRKALKLAKQFLTNHVGDCAPDGPGTCTCGLMKARAGIKQALALPALAEKETQNDPA